MLVLLFHSGPSIAVEYSTKKVWFAPLKNPGLRVNVIDVTSSVKDMFVGWSGGPTKKKVIRF